MSPEVNLSDLFLRARNLDFLSLFTYKNVTNDLPQAIIQTLPSFLLVEIWSILK